MEKQSPHKGSWEQAVKILWVLLIHQLLVISPALCTRAWVGPPGKHACV